MTHPRGHGSRTDAAGQGGPLTRRRAVRIVAAAAGVPVLIAAVRAAAPEARLFRWHGEVLGAVSELALWHTDAAAAQRAIVRVRGEIARHERIFSLYRPDSDISRLNAAGMLANPAPELVGLIETSRRFSALSGGAFDISVQPLWRLYEAHFWPRENAGSDAARADLLARAADTARDLVDYRGIDTGTARIALARPGMAITLNSLAQGFITDAAAELLRNEGFESAVIDLGEFRTLGRHPDGHRWRIGIRDPRPGGQSAGGNATGESGEDGIARTVELEDTALAVSGGYGTTFEPTGRFHHIFDPHTGASATAALDVAVTGPTAVAANGLATTICVTGEAGAQALVSAFPGTRATLTRPDGTEAVIAAAATT